MLAAHSLDVTQKRRVKEVPTRREQELIPSLSHFIPARLAALTSAKPSKGKSSCPDCPAKRTPSEHGGSEPKLVLSEFMVSCAAVRITYNGCIIDQPFQQRLLMA